MRNACLDISPARFLKLKIMQEFDYLTEYSRHRSLNKLAELTGLSRNTVKARILEAGGTIRPRDGNNGRVVKYCHFTARVNQALSDRLDALVAETSLDKSEVVRRAIAVYLSKRQKIVKAEKGCTIALNVWVTPETLAKIDARGMGRAEVVRRAIGKATVGQLKSL